ncbi:hypothetical protein KY289_027953 [Solanum tuberosum]|nr:hypothetical protein KY289_027953 [Solanum tuberosum]
MSGVGGGQPLKDVSFSNLLQNQGYVSMEVPSKSVTYVDGIPHIQWTMAEVEQMNIKEDLQLAVGLDLIP